jgi:hypothetical protein
MKNIETLFGKKCLGFILFERIESNFHFITIAACDINCSLEKNSPKTKLKAHSMQTIIEDWIVCYVM